MVNKVIVQFDVKTTQISRKTCSGGTLSTEITLAAQDWLITTDVVMGGLSTLTFRNSSDSLQLSGTLSHQNSGGFVSARIRDSILNPPSISKGIEIEWGGDERSYRIVLHEEDRRKREYFSVKLSTSQQRISWEDFVYQFRTIEDLDRQIRPHKISSVGVLLSGTHEGPVDFQFNSLRWWL